MSFLRSIPVGPMRVAQFVTGGLDEVIQADGVGFVKALLGRCSKMEVYPRRPDGVESRLP